MHNTSQIYKNCNEFGSGTYSCSKFRPSLVINFLVCAGLITFDWESILSIAPRIVK